MGAVCGAVFRAAGPQELKKECDKFPEGCPTGDAVLTSACRLVPQNKHIIHAVGPNMQFSEDQTDSKHLLRSAYTRSMDEAVKAGDRSIAFPSISTGIFGYNREKAAKECAEAIYDFLLKNSNTMDVIELVFPESAKIKAELGRAALEEKGIEVRML